MAEYRSGRDVVEFFSAKDEQLRAFFTGLDSDARESVVRDLDAAITLGQPRLQHVLRGWYAQSVWYTDEPEAARAGALARMLGYELQRVYEIDPAEVVANLGENDESALPVAVLAARSLLYAGKRFSDRDGPPPVHPDTIWANPAPTRHLFRSVCLCPKCDIDTAQDRWEVQLPAYRQGFRTLFTGTKREPSQWTTCAACGQLYPEDAAAERVVRVLTASR